MGVFVEQFASKMTFMYEGKEITLQSVEMELAQKYPNVPSPIVDIYIKKIEERILERPNVRKKVEQCKKELAMLEVVIKSIEQQIQELVFWQKWLGKEKELQKQKEYRQNILSLKTSILHPFAMP